MNEEQFTEKEGAWGFIDASKQWNTWGRVAVSLAWEYARESGSFVKSHFSECQEWVGVGRWVVWGFSTIHAFYDYRVEINFNITQNATIQTQWLI